GTALAQPVAPGDSAIQVLENIWVAGHPGSVTIDGEEMLVTAVSSQDSAHWSVKRAQNGTAQASHAAGAAVTPTNLSQDRPFLDFSPGAAFSVYNWELFYHIPNYVAELLSQNLQFQDARDWFHYIFNPTKQGPSATPQRFWSTKPLHALSAKQMQSEEIATLLMDVNSGDKAAVDQVKQWRHDPFNPFALADVRPVAYMKSTVMSYLDNLIAWADNLFASQSREALSEATLIYVIAQEILGPAPTAIRPPAVADKSFAQLAPDLDAFANALVDIENAVRPGVVSGVAPVKPVHPVASHALYFKIPPNDKLLGYWSTVADRLYKLRHCQNISGEALQLALFDARIDPGMLVAARAAGVDLGSVLASLNAPPPHYRFTALYTQALDFVNAVRDYGAALQSALEKVDASALALLQQTTQQQLLQDSAQILDWKVQQAQANLDALNETLNQAQAKHDFHSSRPFNNEWEQASVTTHNAANTAKGIAGVLHSAAAGLAAIPNLSLGTAGGFSSPVATGGTGGLSLSQAGDLAAKAADMVAQGLQIASDVSKKLGDWNQRKTESAQQAVEAQTQINHATNQIKAAEFALQIAQAQQDRHQERIDDIQKQIDFMTDKFTSKSLYDWMVGNLSATYFQSYRLAYQMCKQVEQCYHAELGEQDSFIQFSYWDSLHKGLLAGEGLSHDLRRLQAAYLAKNKRRFELSRHIPLSSLPGNPLGELKGINRKCSFDLKEDLFYPGHYNRRIVRVSVTIDYPNRGEFDNVKATLALNGHAIQTAPNEPVPNPLPAPATPQKIALSNAQDDPGLFVAGDIRHNLADPRYLPFENCGAISNWTLDMTQENNGVDPSTVNDVIIHLYYTALD
ncbi:MAG: hypothetical protein LBQ32_07825, partial [Burkholderiaceae bacterium]|nr:hypothetical protein [Burkholderiaceae bacterium]